MPLSWMAFIHEWLGMGVLSDKPVTGLHSRSSRWASRRAGRSAAGSRLLDGDLISDLEAELEIGGNLQNHPFQIAVVCEQTRQGSILTAVNDLGPENDRQKPRGALVTTRHLWRCLQNPWDRRATSADERR